MGRAVALKCESGAACSYNDTRRMPGGRLFMKRCLALFLASASIAVNCLCAVPAATATAQTVRRGAAIAGNAARQITALRRELLDAIRSRDRKTLERLYADDFTHTHAVGRVDNKSQRIAALVSGETTIESAEVDDMSIRTYGATTAIVIGQSTIKGQGEGQSTTRYRWLAVYVKRAGRWQIVASQATRIEQE